MRQRAELTFWNMFISSRQSAETEEILLRKKEVSVPNVVCRGGGVCVLSGDDGTSVTIIKQFSETPAHFWSLSSWKRDLLPRNRDLHVGAAGRVWYRSCLSRRREICKQGVAHDSSCRCQPVPTTAGIQRAQRMTSQHSNLPLYFKKNKNKTKKTTRTHHDTALKGDIIQIKSCWTIKNHQTEQRRLQFAFRWDKSNTFPTGNGKNMVIFHTK